MRRSLSTPLLLIAVLALASCSKTNWMSLSVNQPSPVYLRPEIQRIGIINRSEPSEKTSRIDQLDKIFSAEGKDLDKEGAQSAIKGLAEELGSMGRFTEVYILGDVDVKSPGMGVYPNALSWQQIEEICDEYEVDAIYALSFYDTDTRVEYSTIPVEITGPLGVKIPAVEHQARVFTQIKSGWRIYDPAVREFPDEFILRQEVVSQGRGINPAKAAEAIIGRKENVLRASNELGQDYAVRILPFRIRVSRKYFVRGTENFRIARRRAQTRNWDGAAELWELETGNRRRKIAGRACYNMAIISEINGDLDMAIEWASRSYTDYRIKLALDYLNLLRNRVAAEAVLESQGN